jgi:hypothetical protein
MSEQAAVVIETLSQAGVGEAVSAFAQEIELWMQADAELASWQRSTRKLAQIFAELKPLVVARGGKRSKGEKNQLSWEKAITQRGLKVRTVDDWIAREAAGWPKQWPPKQGQAEADAGIDSGESDDQSADSANCSDSLIAPAAPLTDSCEPAEPTDRRQLLDATYGQFQTVFQPMLARDPEEFLQELRLHFQIIVNRLVGDGEGFTVLFTHIPEGLGKQ